MGRSSNSSNSALISGESGPAYLPNFPPVSHHHHHHYPNSQNHQIPSPPHHHLHQSQYLSQLANASQFYGDLSGGGGGNPNNLTPPNRVYSPLSHGSNSSTGSSALSFVSGSGSSGGLTGPSGGALMDGIPNGGESSNNNNNNSVKYEYDDFPQEADGGPVKTDTWKDHVSVFNLEQVGVMCDVLLQENDMPRLIELLSSTAKDFLGRSEKILRAQAHVAYHAALDDPRKFVQVYKILESHSFSPEYHAGLQKLWFNAHYKEAEITRGRPQGAVDKYRIRRKFPLPRTIWDGEETIYCFKEKSRNALRESFRIEKYPNLEEKKKLSKETGLTMTQVGNWFKNKRQREKEKQQGKQAAKRSKSPFNSPVALAAAAMNSEFLGLMLNGGGGAMAPPTHQFPPHHHHPTLQSQLAPLSPEEFENALRKARFVDDPGARLKSYIVSDSAYSGVPGVAPSTASSSPSSAASSTYLGPHSGGNNNSSTTTSSSKNGKGDITTVGIVSSSPGSSNGGQNHHHQQASPLNNALTITAIPSPNNCDNSSGPGVGDQDSGNNNNNNNADGSSPLNEDINAGIYLNRPRSSDSVHRAGGAELLPYLQSGGHPHPHHHNHPHHHHHHNQLLHHPSQHIQHHHSHHPYHAHHHHHHHHLHHAHQSVASPIPPGYDTGVVPLVHNNAAAALSHA